VFPFYLKKKGPLSRWDPIKGIFNQNQEQSIINIFQQEPNQQQTRAKVEPEQQQIAVF
jgi:hypothetical protein